MRRADRPRFALVSLDPRTLIGLLVASSVLAFLPKSPAVELALVLAMVALQVIAGHPRLGIIFSVLFVALRVLLDIVIPAAGGLVATMFTMSLTFSRQIFLCLMAGALLMAETSAHRLTSALQRLRVPRSIVIPLTVTMRYFPTLRAEASHIRDAMRLREIPLGRRFEAFIVPLMMSATNTADELSRSATCRGIENPATWTDTERLRMGTADWVTLTLAAAAIAGVAALSGWQS